MYNLFNYTFQFIENKKKVKLNKNLIINIIKYNSNIKNKLVSSDWYFETNKIHKKSVIKIERWYNKYLKPKYLFDNELFNKKSVIRLYNYKYPTNYLLHFPENVIRKCNLNNNLLNDLKLLKYRKRSDIINWLLKSEITIDNIINAGW